jgi:uncharacterized protein (TIGR02217 family)
MSQAVFPSLPGQSIEVSRTPGFSTRIQTAVSGKETRAAFMRYPKYRLTAKFDVIRDEQGLAELQTLEAFFLQMRGAHDSFLVSAPSDNTVTDMLFGNGNGLTRIFQLTRTRGAGGFGFTEPCENLASAPTIKVDGVALTDSDYSISASGVLTFVTAPAADADLTWSGTFYYRCRFVEDEATFDRFLENLWSLGEIEMIGAPGNKV